MTTISETFAVDPRCLHAYVRGLLRFAIREARTWKALSAQANREMPSYHRYIGRASALWPLRNLGR